MAFPASLLLALCAASITLAIPQSGKASTYAGVTSSAVFPPTSVPTDASVSTYFPGPEEVGHPGPTLTGDEPYVIATAAAQPQKGDVYPLVDPGQAQTPVGTSAFDVTRYWGNLTPFFSVGDVFGLDNTSAAIPSGCELTQVHLLHRHGARYPTSGGDTTDFAEKVHAAANSTGFTASGPLEFLNTWTYKLGSEILTPYGRQQLFDLGVSTRMKYGHLLENDKDLNVFRTTSEARMVDSALHFAAGFFGVQQYKDSYHQLIQIEDIGFNSTLAPFTSCANAQNDVMEIGYQAARNWTVVYLNESVPRLQQYVDGIKLNVGDARAMQDLCAYETVALGYSKFCNLFTEEEWMSYEYGTDIGLWYSYGPGNFAAAAQGIGYVQELVARLTKTPITEFATSLNATLDGSNVTFPLDQNIYVDATHDTVISMVLTALNFSNFVQEGPLPVDHIPENHTHYNAQYIVPFASRLETQVVSCPAGDDSADKKPFIRFVLNDGVLPLTGAKYCTENKDGLCPVDDFVKSMQERIAEVDYQYDCFANYTVPWPDPITDGRAIKA
ncbi:phosphoglycerate mutase-like protein [Trametes elegans]|nr:phosphoglycerate mutase-like protein [Trametes elegans]